MSKKGGNKKSLLGMEADREVARSLLLLPPSPLLTLTLTLPTISLLFSHLPPVNHTHSIPIHPPFRPPSLYSLSLPPSLLPSPRPPLLPLCTRIDSLPRVTSRERVMERLQSVYGRVVRSAVLMVVKLQRVVRSGTTEGGAD